MLGGGGRGSKPFWYHFGVIAPPILEPMSVGIEMFTGAMGFDPRPGGPVDGMAGIG